MIRAWARGDVLMTTDAIEKLGKKHPSMKVTYCTWHEAAPVLQSNPWVDDLQIAPTGYTLPQPTIANGGEPFDKKIIFDYEKPGRPTAPVFTFDEQAGVSKENPRYHLYLNTPDYTVANGLQKPYITICGLAGWPSRRWVDNRWAVVARIIETWGYSVYYLVPPWEKAPPGCNRIPGSLRRNAAIIEKSRLFIGVDSFCMNAAIASNTPMIILNGHTAAHWHGGSYQIYMGKQAVEVRGDPGPDDIKRGSKNRLKDISPGTVIDVAKAVLNGGADLLGTTIWSTP